MRHVNEEMVEIGRALSEMARQKADAKKAEAELMGRMGHSQKKIGHAAPDYIGFGASCLPGLEIAKKGIGNAFEQNAEDRRLFGARINRLETSGI